MHLLIEANPAGGLLGQLLSGLLCDLLAAIGNIGAVVDLLNRILGALNSF